MSKFLFLILLGTLLLSVSDAYSQCTYFDRLIYEGDAKFYSADFLGAINKYQAAISVCWDRSGVAQERVLKVFGRIDRLWMEAIVARNSADSTLQLLLKANEKLKTAVEDANAQRDAADQAKIDAEIAVEEMHLQQARNEKLIRAFYFYDGKFALAYGDLNHEGKRFYFIDKLGNIVNKLGTWDSVEQFDMRGFARVSANGVRSLLETFGNQYPLALGIEELTHENMALDLAGRGIETFPASLRRYSSIKMLLLSSNSLKAIPADIGKFPDMAILEIQQNRIVRIAPEIGRLVTLRRLNASDNLLEKLPDELEALVALTKLNLTNNRLESLPDGIGSLISLEELNLRGNPLGTLPNSICELSQLKRLEVGTGVEMSRMITEQRLYLENETTRIVQLIEDSVRQRIPKYLNPYPLTTLLNDSVFVQTPSKNGEKSQIAFRLAHAPLSSLPEDFGRLSSLEFLDLSGNELTKLPVSMAKLSGLISLNLSSNRLGEFLPELCLWKSLEILDLSYNQLEHLPATFRELTSLRACALSYNRLQTFPEDLLGMRSLETLWIGHNPCSDTPEEQATISFRMHASLPNCKVVFE